MPVSYLGGNEARRPRAAVQHEPPRRTAACWTLPRDREGAHVYVVYIRVHLPVNYVRVAIHCPVFRRAGFVKPDRLCPPWTLNSRVSVFWSQASVSSTSRISLLDTFPRSQAFLNLVRNANNLNSRLLCLLLMI